MEFLKIGASSSFEIVDMKKSSSEFKIYLIILEISTLFSSKKKKKGVGKFFKYNFSSYIKIDVKKWEPGLGSWWWKWKRSDA